MGYPEMTAREDEPLYFRKYNCFKLLSQLKSNKVN